ncbi:MAG TPA: hypothetical protein VGL72_33020 [Bryobacteraceae bacterium]
MGDRHIAIAPEHWDRLDDQNKLAINPLLPQGCALLARRDRPKHGGELVMKVVSRLRGIRQFASRDAHPGFALVDPLSPKAKVGRETF